MVSCENEVASAFPVSDGGEMKVNGLLISIVCYRTPVLEIKKVLDFIGLQKLNFDVNVAIVDNFGDDDLRLFCESDGHGYLYPGSNLGFGRGHNIAVDKFKKDSDFVLILNPDVFITYEAIDSVVSYMIQHPGVVLASPRLLNLDGTPQGIVREFPKPWGLTKRFFRQVFAKDKVNAVSSLDLSSEPVAVPALHGACFFVRADAFEKVGGFSEEYFLYVEDIDLCRKLGAIGDIVYLPMVSAVHALSKGSYKSLKLFRIHLTSFFRYFLKWGIS